MTPVHFIELGVLIFLLFTIGGIVVNFGLMVVIGVIAGIFEGLKAAAKAKAPPLICLAVILAITATVLVLQRPSQQFVGEPKINSHNPAPTAPFDAEKLYSTIDGYRISNGIAGLHRDPTLDAAARIHAEDMKNRNYYDHNTPDGVTPYTRIANAVGAQVYSGENEDQVCYSVNVGDEFSRFTTSPEHNANILEPKYNSVGIGYVASDSTACNGYIVYDFAQE